MRITSPLHSDGCMKKLVMVEEWVSEEPLMVCHHVEEQNCYTVMKTKYVPRKVSRVRFWTVEVKANTGHISFSNTESSLLFTLSTVTLFQNS